MVFSSLLFLFWFLPVALAGYYLTPVRYRNQAALAASLAFFAWGAPRFVFGLMATSLIDYVLSQRFAHDRPAHHRRAALAVSVGINVALLLYFKYANFFVGEFNAVLKYFGQSPVSWTRVILPIGISFFTFQKISYLVDVYRGTAQPAKSYSRYLLYVVLYPQLIAGPIVRYHDVDQQIDRRDHSCGVFLDGIWRFALGLAKKVLIANPMAVLADRLFDAPPAALGPGAAWLGLFAYAMQIFFDFSGYSDMALGLGRMMGFHFLENFDFPYVSRSITEFWRRWHMSLGNFMREYLYVPLGGNRGSRLRTYFNLWVVFLLSGFWHGASWSFIVWGCYHGLLISFERFLRDHRVRPMPAFLAVPRTFLLVCAGWVFFRAETLRGALGYFQALAGRGATAPELAQFLHTELGDPRIRLALALAAFVAFAPTAALQNWFRDWTLRMDAPWAGLRLTWRFAVSMVLMLAVSMSLALGGFNPFIYFRF